MFSRDPLDFSCMACDAPAGEPCRTDKDSKLVRGFHVIRHPFRKHAPVGCLAARLCERRGCIGLCRTG